MGRRFVTAVTGGPVPVIPGGSGVVGSVFPAGRFHHARPSLSGSGGPVSVCAILTGIVYHRGNGLSSGENESFGW